MKSNTLLLGLLILVSHTTFGAAPSLVPGKHYQLITDLTELQHNGNSVTALKGNEFTLITNSPALFVQFYNLNQLIHKNPDNADGALTHVDKNNYFTLPAQTAAGTDIRSHLKPARRTPWYDMLALDGYKYRFFSPSARVFFDIGEDEENEIDVFKDGSISISLSMIEFIGLNQLGSFKNGGHLIAGPSIGLGLTAPANDSEDGNEQASSAPVFMLNLGIYGEIELGAADANGNNKSILLEAGWALGTSADESLSDKTDQALYVGIAFNL